MGRDRPRRIHGRQQHLAAGGRRLPDRERGDGNLESAERNSTSALPPARVSPPSQSVAQWKSLLPLQQRQHLLIHEVRSSLKLFFVFYLLENLCWI